MEMEKLKCTCILDECSFISENDDCFQFTIDWEVLLSFYLSIISLQNGKNKRNEGKS